MARIQVLALPTEQVGGYKRTPFALIIDHAEPEAWTDFAVEQLRANTGANTVILFEGDLDAPGALTLTEEQAEQLRIQVTAHV